MGPNVSTRRLASELVSLESSGRSVLSAPRPRGFIQSLEKGLAVINSFSVDRSTQTPAEVAEQVGVSRSTARRILLTLGKLGYADRDRLGFRLTSKVLDLGYSFLSSLRVADVAQQPMERLVDELGEFSSMSILDDAEIVCVAWAPSKRIMTVAMGLGSRLPAYPTAMGRVLLAGLGHDVVEDRLSRVELKPLTPYTITDRSALKARIERVRADGLALVDQELEIGIRSIAAPVTNSRGEVIAAVEISCHATRVSVSKLKSEFMPRLLAAVEEINFGTRTLGRI